MDSTEWAQVAENAVRSQYLRPLLALPRAVLATPRPARPYPVHLLIGRWNYWWQAQLLDAMVDAQQRAADPRRRHLCAHLVSGIRLRNGSWTNNYHDDMAWLALALQRDTAVNSHDHGTALARLAGHLVAELDPAGMLTWRCGDGFRNVPANAPTAIMFARSGQPQLAQRIVGVLLRDQQDPETGLMIDGIHADGRRVTEFYTYCQGVMIGALTELAVVTGDRGYADTATELVDAVAAHMTIDGVLHGQGAGDGGLFAGILARYLADAARRLGTTVAGQLVRDSAAAAWQNRRKRDRQLPAFSVEWRESGGYSPDLSVQLSAWMLFEAAATLD